MWNTGVHAGKCEITLAMLHLLHFILNYSHCINPCAVIFLARTLLLDCIILLFVNFSTFLERNIKMEREINSLTFAER